MQNDEITVMMTMTTMTVVGKVTDNTFIDLHKTF